ncbi:MULTISPECIES: hypothetical protein [Chromobacteriaceae]|nr:MULTISPECIES: hypothetical protein [Chromobacteriaceae]
MAHVVVYGFGSFFLNKAVSNDVDLLLVHEDISPDSCALAILCKKYLTQRVDKAHITILSKTEELDLGFVAKAQAHRISIIEHEHLEDGINEITQRLNMPL